MGRKKGRLFPFWHRSVFIVGGVEEERDIGSLRAEGCCCCYRFIYHHVYIISPGIWKPPCFTQFPIGVVASERPVSNGKRSILIAWLPRPQSTPANPHHRVDGWNAGLTHTTRRKEFPDHNKYSVTSSVQLSHRSSEDSH